MLNFIKTRKKVRMEIYGILGKRKAHILLITMMGIVMLAAIQGCQKQGENNAGTGDITAEADATAITTAETLSTAATASISDPTAKVLPQAAENSDLTDATTENSQTSMNSEEVQNTGELLDKQDKWYYAKVTVRTYPALMSADQVASRYAALPELCTFNQEYYKVSAADSAAVVHIAERFADLTENTFERKYDETAEWCYLSISECWSVIDKWDKMSQLVAYKVADVNYISSDACTVNIVEFVNDDYNPATGAYDGQFDHTGEWLGHLHFERRANGWVLASEDYEPVDMQTQRIIRGSGTVYIS